MEPILPLNAIKKLPHRRHFIGKMAKYALAAFFFLIFSLGIGMAGYHYFMDLSWVDSLINASMILTGMGPVDRAETSAAKIFASFYAIYSGMAFLTTAALIFSPLLHRFLHKLHLDIKG
ncbi:MAG: hypothetical protein ACJ76F_10835 [Bacteroidia bacterium]